MFSKFKIKLHPKLSPQVRLAVWQEHLPGCDKADLLSLLFVSSSIFSLLYWPGLREDDRREGHLL